MHKPAPLEVIQAGVGKEVRLVRVDDVVYFESDTRYKEVWTEYYKLMHRRGVSPDDDGFSLSS